MHLPDAMIPLGGPCCCSQRSLELAAEQLSHCKDRLTCSCRPPGQWLPHLKFHIQLGKADVLTCACRTSSGASTLMAALMRLARW